MNPALEEPRPSDQFEALATLLSSQMRSPLTVLKIDPATYTANVAHAYSELPSIVAAIVIRGRRWLERTRRRECLLEIHRTIARITKW